MSEKLSKEEIKKEIIKCGKNPQYFLKNYAKITHAERGTIPFKTYKFQDEMLDNFRDNRFNIIVKARQLGISTIVAGYIAWPFSPRFGPRHKACFSWPNALI
jgi:hypothetical protein